jgi:hypothetical protein
LQAVELDSEAFNSISWLCISEETMLESLKFVRPTRRELLMPVLRWAQFHLEVEGRDPEDGSNLREKMLPALHLLRFCFCNIHVFLGAC